jgi:uncharacterized protein
MGLVVSGIWLHLITPSQNALLIVLCGLLTQGFGIWRVRHAIRWKAVVPFIAGSAVGVAGGTVLLTTVGQKVVRMTMGVLLIIFSIYSLARPKIAPSKGGAAVEVGVGIINGVIGGLTGLGGIGMTIWSQLRGGNKDAQRAIFQPVMFATFLITAISFGFAGSYNLETMKLYALALPPLIVGVGCDLWLYGKLNDAAFRRVVLILLFGSGLSLVVSAALRAAGLCRARRGKVRERTRSFACDGHVRGVRSALAPGTRRLPARRRTRPSSAQHSTCRADCAWTNPLQHFLLPSPHGSASSAGRWAIFV